MVSQKWNLVSDGKTALTVVNSSTYGSDYKDGELRITCLRSPGYSAGKSDFSVRKPYIMEQDRFSPFIDQGEHDFTFTVKVGDDSERKAHIERESAVLAEAPMALSFFPTGCAKRKRKYYKALRFAFGRRYNSRRIQESRKRRRLHYPFVQSDIGST